MGEEKIKLSRNFTLKEFTDSEIAKYYKWDNIPPEEAVDNLEELCVNLLQPIRDYIKKPMKVNSGYREPRLNRAVKGSSKSQHLTGQAADIAGLTMKEVRTAINELDLKFDQIIYYSTFIHFSYNKNGNRQQQFFGK